MAPTIHYLNQWWLIYWCIYMSLSLNELTHWGQNKMATNLLVTISNLFSSMKNVLFSFKLQGSPINNIQALVQIMGWHLTGNSLALASVSQNSLHIYIVYKLTPCTRCRYLCFSLLHIAVPCLCFILVYQCFAAQLCHIFSCVLVNIGSGKGVFPNATELLPDSVFKYHQLSL